jgi:hypothetical protein
MRLVRAWIGLVLVAFGVLGLLDAAEVLDAGAVIGRWWPIAIVGLGISAMLSQGHISVGPAVVTVFGIVLLISVQGWFNQDIVGPTLLIMVGAAILVGLATRRTVAHTSRVPVAVFGGTDVQDRSEHLTRTGVSAVFGSATLDLRDAHIDREGSVDAFAFCGGITIVVPRGWRVSLGGLPIFGGYGDKTKHNGALPPDAPLLKVNATAIFGGVEVANERR